MSEAIYQLWLYNNWANQILLTAFIHQENQIPAGCLHLMSHIVNAQMIWLSRTKGEQPKLNVWQDHSAAGCLNYHNLSSSGLQQKITQYANEGNIEITYTNSSQHSFSNSLQDILLHIFNHGTYHRAQIATEMKRNGLEPINTDYINFVRQT